MRICTGTYLHFTVPTQSGEEGEKWRGGGKKNEIVANLQTLKCYFRDQTTKLYLHLANINSNINPSSLSHVKKFKIKLNYFLK